MNHRKLIKFVLIWSITLTVFLLLFSRINVKEAWKFFREINQSLFFLAIGISIFGNVYLSGQKYRRLLQLLKCDISLGEAILIKLGTIPLKHILPLKSGEVMRALYLKQRHNLSYVKGGCSILMGMGLSLISLLVIVLLTGFFYNYDLKQRYYFGVPILGGLIVGAMAFRKGVLPQATHTWLESTNGKIAAVVKDITEVSKGEHYKRRVIALLGYSMGFEGAKLVCCLLIFIASGIVIPPEPVLFYTPMVLMISSLPITVFGLGTREAAMLTFFGEYATPAQLLSAGLAFSFIESIVPLLLGLCLVKPFLSRLMGAHEK